VDELLIFRLGTSKWGLPSRQVHQVLPATSLARVPGAPLPLLGLVAWQTLVIEVLSLATCLGCADPPKGQGTLLVVETRPKNRPELVALLVDQVLGFVRELTNDVRPLDLDQVLDDRLCG
jgi:chemotaxis signal transduction protein